jgi:hypothetical protein
MGDIVMKQETISDKKPEGYEPKLKIKRMLSYKIDRDTGRLVFEYLPDGPDDTVPAATILNLDVWEDTEFTLRLDANRAWHWSKNYHAITTKKDKKNLYGLMQYDRNGVFETWDGKKPKDFECMRVRFVADKNNDVNDRVHSFSMNIDLVLPNGAILPIALDPDIENPPIGGGGVPVGGGLPGGDGIPGDGEEPAVRLPGLLSAITSA